MRVDLETTKIDFTLVNKNKSLESNSKVEADVSLIPNDSGKIVGNNRPALNVKSNAGKSPFDSGFGRKLTSKDGLANKNADKSKPISKTEGKLSTGAAKPAGKSIKAKNKTKRK